MEARINDMNKSELILNLNKLHTTKLGIERIKRNLSLEEIDVVQACRDMIQDTNSSITKRGKNWYVNINSCEITINAHSLTIITAHKLRKPISGE